MNSKTYILIILLFNTMCIGTFAQTNNFYYVKSTNYLSEDTARKVTGVSYKDAYGRAIQDIVLNASPAGNDIVQTYQYDSLGRVLKSYLPFIDNSGQNGEFIEDVLYLQQSSYDAVFPNKNAFSQFEYDNSPYNKIIMQSSPGDDISTTNISSDYTPAGSDVEYWYVNDNNDLIKDGNYTENSLMKFTVKDADNKKTHVFKDKSGKTLLKMNDLKSVLVKTRFVYDKFGQLRYVLSPEAVSQMTGNSYDKNSDLVKKYCYYYEYNAKHQLISKQLPGKEPVYLRYDKLYRLRATQDGNQRQENKWMFINYDKFGRTISTGLGLLNINNVFPDTITPPPNNGISSFLTYQYYDNYDFIDNDSLQFDSTLAYHDKFTRIRGKSTGSKVRVMNDETEKWLTSVVYYDKYGHVIQTISQNNIDGYDIVSNKYDFAGQLIESRQKHTAGQQIPKFLVYLYKYDTQGRLLTLRLSQNLDTSNAVIINKINYNEFGQAVQKKIHSEHGTHFLQTEDFAFNIKSALTDINEVDNLGEDLFALKLSYDTYKDGKISALQWNSANLNAVQTYTYEYDNLNRLTKANFTPGGRYDVNINYDLNGNITHLDRKGEIISQIRKETFGKPEENKYFDLIDDLTYEYDGNQLIRTFDAAGEINTQLNNDYHSIDIKSNEFIYDANGNVTWDINKGITNIKYNHLNQPTEVDFGTKKTVYTYTATGGMLKTEIYQNGKLKSTTDYNGAFVYENNTLSFINIPGGRIRKDASHASHYEYNLTDHLGNVRVTFKDSSGTAVIIQEDHYYPFGMRMSGQHFSNTDLVNKYLYNGKEQQEQTGYYDYGFRQLDPQLGRWHVVDAMAEKYYSTTPYAYTSNDPINHIDILGLSQHETFEWAQQRRFYHNNVRGQQRYGDDRDYIYRDSGLSYLGGLMYLRPAGIGPTFEDIEDYKSLPEATRKKMSLGEWWGKQLFALAGTNMTRQQALKQGYTFTEHWRKKTETLTCMIANDPTGKVKIPISEVIIINERYYELDDVWFGDIETGVENKIGSVIITDKQRLSKQQLLDLTKNEKKRFEQYGNYTNYLLAAISVSVLKNPYMSGGAILTGISVNKAISQTNGNFDTFTKEINDKFPDGVSIVTKQRSYYNTINMTTSANISIFVYSNGGVLIGEISYATP